MCFFFGKKAKKKRIIKRLDNEILGEITKNDEERLKYLQMKMEMAEQLYSSKIDVKKIDKLLNFGKYHRKKKIIKVIDNEILKALIKDDPERLRLLKMKKEMAEKLYTEDSEANTNDFFFFFSKRSIVNKLLNQIDYEILDDMINNKGKNLKALNDKKEIVKQSCVIQGGFFKKLFTRFANTVAYTIGERLGIGISDFIIPDNNSNS